MPPTIMVTVGMLPAAAALLDVLPLGLLLLGLELQAATAMAVAVATAASATAEPLRNMGVLLIIGVMLDFRDVLERRAWLAPGDAVPAPQAPAASVCAGGRQLRS